MYVPHRRALLILSTALVLSLLGVSPARAQGTTVEDSPPTAAKSATGPTPFGGDNLRGLRGLARTMAATNNVAGYVALGTNLEFFTASKFVRDGPNGSGTLRDHSRFVNSYSLSVAPLRFLEAALSMHVISDNTSGTPDGLQVAVGDWQLTVKGGYEVTSGLSLGGLLDLRFPSGSGFFEASLDSTNVTLAALASYTLASLPLSFHLNAGFVIDGSENLLSLDSIAEHQTFAAQISSFNRALTRIGIEYTTKYIGPFLEWSIEPFVGSGAPGVGDSPMRLTLGVRTWLGSKKGLQILAAADIGLTGVGPRDPDTLKAEKHAFTIPRWNLLLRLSYRFDPFAPPQVKTIIKRGDGGTGSGGTTVVAGPKLASIGGTVIDKRSGKPVWTARVRIGSKVSSLAVDPQKGSFNSYKLPLGTHKLVVSAKGYHDATVSVQLTEGGATQQIKLTPRAAIAPGTIRGTVKAVGGKKVRRATVLIPALDRTIKVGRSGVFTIELKPGEYKVVVSARGYRTQRKTIRVVEGETVILNVDLHR